METDRESATEDSKNASERFTGVDAGDGRMYGSNESKAGDDETGSPREVSKESDKDVDDPIASDTCKDAGD